MYTGKSSVGAFELSFVCCLILIGAMMAYVTWQLISTIVETFPQEFADTEHKMKICLIVFLSTYIVRFLDRLFLVIFKDWYHNIWL